MELTGYGSNLFRRPLTSEHSGSRKRPRAGFAFGHIRLARVLAAGVALLYATPAFARTYYADINSTNPVSPFSSWATAATDIQTAVNVATNGDTVLVNDGVYGNGAWVTPGYSLPNCVVITNDICVQSVNGPAVTVIQGQSPMGTGAVRCVFITNGTLAGFTLTNGCTLASGDWEYDLSGGGAYAVGGVLSNCTLAANSAWHAGGGAYCGTLANCALTANSASWGGGVYGGTLANCTLTANAADNDGGGAESCTLTNCTLTGNSAFDGGGTCYGTLANCTLTGNFAQYGGGAESGGLANCTLTANSAVRYGGGAESCTLTNCTLVGNSATDPASGSGGGSSYGALYNCTLAGNTAVIWGGGAYEGWLYNCTIGSNSASDPVSGTGGGAYEGWLCNCTLTANSAAWGGGVYEGALCNCTLAGNTATGDGGGVEACTLTNCIVCYNTAPSDANYDADASLNHCCTTPLPPGKGNITNDPSFVNYAAGNLRLGTGSPCINAGINQAWMVGATDLAGDPRISGGVVDIGAYESSNAVITASAGLGGSINPSGTVNVAIFSNQTFTITPNPLAATAVQNVLVDGSSIGPTNSYTFFNVTTNHTIGATFALIPFTLTVTSSYGVASPPPGLYTNLYGTVLTNCVTPLLLNAGLTQYVCTGWTMLGNAPQSGTTNSFTMAVTNNATLSWVWQTQYQLNATAGPNGSAIPSNGWYAAGSPATVTAAPNYSYAFSGWTGDVPAGHTNDNPLILIMDQTHSVAAAFVAGAPVHYVWTNSPCPTNPYTCWATAARTIQAAINASASTDTVFVTNGVYSTGAMQTPGYSASNRVAITNGVLVQSVNGPAVTIIQGQGPAGAKAVRCAFITNGTLAGFTLTNGFTASSGDHVHDESGAGAYAAGGGLVNCTLAGNSANYYGGGTYSGTLANCTLVGNSASQSGGAAYYGVLTNCTLIGNSASHYGGGAYYGTLVNCTLVGNSASQSGGGIYCGALTNCIVYYNTSGSNYAGSPSLIYCCTTPKVSGTGNITNGPCFLNTNRWSNLGLAAGSPCINAGTNQNWMIGAADLGGNPRIVGGVADMGAYESTNGATTNGIPWGWLLQYNLATDGSADLLDCDGNGMDILQDYRAGLNPTNPLACLRMEGLVPCGGSSGALIQWQSVADKLYTLDCSTNLSALPPFTNLASNIVGQAGCTTYTDTNATGPGPYFYRVWVQ